MAKEVSPCRLPSSSFFFSKVIGTHNSYHWRTNIPVIRDMFSYDFPSIAGQLDAGVRHLELDVHYDWKTGRSVSFSIRQIGRIVGLVSADGVRLRCVEWRRKTAGFCYSS